MRPAGESDGCAQSLSGLLAAGNGHHSEALLSLQLEAATLCHPRACLICPLPSCWSLDSANASPPQNICVWMYPPHFSGCQIALNLGISGPEALLTFKGPLYHVFLASLAFCALPRSPPGGPGCGARSEAAKEMRAGGAIHMGKNFVRGCRLSIE